MEGQGEGQDEGRTGAGVGAAEDKGKSKKTAGSRRTGGKSGGKAGAELLAVAEANRLRIEAARQDGARRLHARVPRAGRGASTRAGRGSRLTLTAR